MNEPTILASQPNRVILYTTSNGKVTVDVCFHAENFWLPQKAMAELFGVKPAAISKHLKNIYESGELTAQATTSKMESVQIEGMRQITRELEYYNLDAVIAVGYRVNSLKATHFRIWATTTLREFMLKGFYLTMQCLKMDEVLGWITLKNYWSGYAKFAQVSAALIKKLPMCLSITGMGHPHNKVFLWMSHLLLNFDQWQSKIAATNFKIKGFPVFFALNDKAESTGRNIDGGAWGKDTPENMAPPLKAFFAK